jgi:hypothetical protein
MGVSRDWISKIERGQEAPSEAFIGQMESLEVDAGLVSKLRVGNLDIAVPKSETFADRLCMLLQRDSSITIDDLAGAIRKSAKYLRSLAFTPGHPLPSDETILDIARFYQINPAWLKDGSGKMEAPPEMYQHSVINERIKEAEVQGVTPKWGSSSRAQPHGAPYIKRLLETPSTQATLAHLDRHGLLEQLKLYLNDPMLNLEEKWAYVEGLNEIAKQKTVNEGG